MSAAATTLPLVTVAIVARNRREELTMTLQKVTRELEYPGDRMEIIVVDNGSTDGTPAMLKSDFPAVQVISNATNEGAPAWNRAFRVGRGEFFLILDDDATLPARRLKKQCMWPANSRPIWSHSASPRRMRMATTSILSSIPDCLASGGVPH